MKLKLKELINNISIYLQPKKDTYTYDEMYQFADQTKQKISSVLSKVEDDVDAEIESLKSAHLKEVEDIKHENTALLKQITELNKKTAQLDNEKITLENSKKSLEEKLIPFQKQEEDKFSKELLNGMVLSGAESDVFSMLSDQEKDFQNLTDIKDKQTKIKPYVQKILEQKTYLKPNPNSSQNFKENSSGASNLIETKTKVDDSEESKQIGKDSDFYKNKGGLVA